MADQVFAYGLGEGTLVTITDGPTLCVIESFDNAGSGDIFELHGNNVGQTVVATRVSNIKDTVSFVGETETYVRAVTMMGKAATVIFKDDSSPQIATTSMTGKITVASLAGGRGPWQYNVTLTLDPPGA